MQFITDLDAFARVWSRERGITCLYLNKLMLLSHAWQIIQWRLQEQWYPQPKMHHADRGEWPLRYEVTNRRTHRSDNTIKITVLSRQPGNTRLTDDLCISKSVYGRDRSKSISIKQHQQQIYSASGKENCPKWRGKNKTPLFNWYKWRKSCLARPADEERTKVLGINIGMKVGQIISWEKLNIKANLRMQQKES